MASQFLVPMQRFTKKLHVSGQKLSFSFNRIANQDDMRYYISVIDSQGKSWLFYMKKIEDGWKVTNPGNSPDWIVALEHDLSTIIAQCNQV